MIKKFYQHLLILLLSELLIACTPNIHPAGPPVSSGELLQNFYVTVDGMELPLRSWQPSQTEIKSIIIAVHGFNDYSLFFQQAGQYFSQHNTLSYAYDQRGFGDSPNRGLWAGIETYSSDLAYFVQLVKHKHPDTAIFLLGESMGGAIVIAAHSQENPLAIDGIILSAPAVWARQTMPWYQNILLWTLSHTVPWLTLSGSDLGIKPSDNIEMLIALGQDSLVIKETRVETLYGLTNLMDHAFSSANILSSNTLLLYGEKDEIIPRQATYRFVKKLITEKPQSHVVAYYENGYHMLLRDLQAPVLWNDINVWMNSFSAPFPSGADKRGLEWLKK